MVRQLLDMPNKDRLMLTHTYTYEHIHTHVHICTHNAHMQCIHMHMHTQAHRQEVWQGGASINRTAGLLGKGGGGPHI